MHTASVCGGGLKPDNKWCCGAHPDEIDAIGKARGAGGGDSGTQEREQGLLQLLYEMDGFRARARPPNGPLSMPSIACARNGFPASPYRCRMM